MKRVKGYLSLCKHCGLVHDSEGAVAGACLAWLGSIRSVNHGITVKAWDTLVNLVETGKQS